MNTGSNVNGRKSLCRNRKFTFKMVSLKLKEGAARTTAAEHRVPRFSHSGGQCPHVVVQASKLQHFLF